MNASELMDEPDLSGFQKAAIIISLKKMFQGNHFDICVVDEVGKLLGISGLMRTADYSALRLMHCINWGTMGAEMSLEVQRKTLDLLGVNLTPAEIVETVPTRENKEGPSLWKKLLFNR
jgi:hypothetical protein